MRIVSVCPSNTEILFALGLGKDIVGVDNASDWPGEVKKIPKVGFDLNIDIEKVKALKPDLVVSSLSVPGMEKVVEGIEKAGLRQLVLSPKSLEEIYTDIRKVGEMTGNENGADVLVKDLRERVKRIEDRTKNKEKKKVYWEWWPRPFITTGKKGWMNELIDKAGGKNIFSDKAEESPQVGEKEIIERNPEFVFVCWCGSLEKLQDVKKVYERKWDVSAIKNKKVFAVEEGIFGRPSQRLIDGLEKLHLIITESRD